MLQFKWTMKRFIYIAVTLFLTLTSCGEYAKVLKTEDTSLMYEKAIEFYNRGDYTHCLNLLDKVKVYAYSVGSRRAQSMAYYRAYATYNKKLYEPAAELFEMFVSTYPDSPFYEECLYMVGLCYYKSSPRALLDQNATNMALRYFQSYLDRYPRSSRKDEINGYMVELLDKVSYKAFLNAQNYYNRSRYVSAIVSLDNCLTEFPASRYREDIMAMLFDAKYQLAVNSIEEKKLERYYDAQEEFLYFQEEFPESRYLATMKRQMEDVEKFLKGYEFED